MLPEPLKAACSATGIAMPPAFIYFDLGNVLARFDRERAFRNMAAVCGGEQTAVREAVMGGLQQSLEAGRIDWPAFHEAFSRQTATESDPAALAAAAADMFELNAEILPVITGLERAGVPIGILSNTCDVHWRHLLDRGWGILPGGFRELVLSHEVQPAKPDPAIFAHAAERAGVATADIFFCDDLPEHVAAAREAGWDAELFTAAGPLLDQFRRRGLNLGLLTRASTRASCRSSNRPSSTASPSISKTGTRRPYRAARSASRSTSTSSHREPGDRQHVLSRLAEVAATAGVDAGSA